MTPVRTPPFTPATPPKSGRTGYAVVEIGEGAIGGVNAVAVGAAAFPGFLLTVPGLLVFLLPVIAVGVLAAVAALAIALATIPLLVGSWGARRVWHALPPLRPPRVPTIACRTRSTAGRPAL